ncbi:hypothetical protein O181_037246 [Austropuccinia psidii MF-1]|uniref:Uncharacterized protein n=1 Tax=Austropuccinia psidii MF-1 TaxID=1389203 RepID=A0A9Q3HAL3_9BASI|nr:hypothetical protein [Austropuccinia psidii MF-1]
MKMVCTRNGRNCSVQPYGSGEGRGNTRARTGKPSSRKEHLKDARLAPHSPRSVQTTLYITSLPELIGGKVLRLEHIQSGCHRDIEDHRTLSRMESLVFQRQGQKDKKLVEEPKYFIYRPEERVEITPALEREGPVASKAPKQSKEKPKEPQKKQRGPNNNQGKGKGKANLHRP